MARSGDKAKRRERSLTGIDRLVHEPARLLIMSYLYVVDSADFVFLLRQTGLTQGNLSSHMSKLEEAGYIEVKKRFVDRRPHTMLSLSKRGASALRAYRRQMEEVFEDLPD